MSDLDVLVDDKSQYLAALDIGSNSIHFVYARLIDNHLQVLHTEKYPIALATGLSADNKLSDEAINRALAVLTLLKDTVSTLSEGNFRAVATFTLRQASNANAFLKKAAKIFPFDIEIISGHEEARLIYQGVAHYHQNVGKQLVIDIGGGSTECVIGEGFDTLAVASLNMGCVSFTRSFFNDGSISAKKFNMAVFTAKIMIESIVKRFNSKGWQHVIGTSGTIKAIYQWALSLDSANTSLTLAHLYQLREELLQFSNIADININGLKETRQHIICAGLSILIALFEMLKIEQLTYCDYALREGVLFEKLDLLQCHDIRDRAVQSLSQRFSVDKIHANDTAELAAHFYQQVYQDWQLKKSIYKKLLLWAAHLHEIGIDINASGFHKHGQYILQNADMAGFNQEQQQALAWLVGNQRKKIKEEMPNSFNLLSSKKLLKTLALLRLALRINQQRQLAPCPEVSIKIKHDSLKLAMDAEWLEQKPLIVADLEQEIALFKPLGIEIKLS